MSTHAFPSSAETRAWIKSFVPELKRPCVVLLSGELGAGKTQLVRWFLEELGANNVASPTFAIHHRYTVRDGFVDHVDLYRVKDDQDLEASGFWDLFLEDDALVFVEWADRLPESVWPMRFHQIHIALAKVSGGEARQMQMEIKTP